MALTENEARLMAAVVEEFGDGAYFDVTDRVKVEVVMLARLGVTLLDWEEAVTTWRRVPKVNDDWSFLRTCLFNRRAEKTLEKMGKR